MIAKIKRTYALYKEDKRLLEFFFLITLIVAYTLLCIIDFSIAHLSFALLSVSLFAWNTSDIYKQHLIIQLMEELFDEQTKTLYMAETAKHIQHEFDAYRMVNPAESCEKNDNKEREEQPIPSPEEKPKAGTNRRRPSTKKKSKTNEQEKKDLD